MKSHDSDHSTVIQFLLVLCGMLRIAAEIRPASDRRSCTRQSAGNCGRLRSGERDYHGMNLESISAAILRYVSASFDGKPKATMPET